MGLFFRVALFLFSLISFRERCLDVGLGAQGSTRGLQQFLFFFRSMRSVDTRQVMGDRFDGEPGAREE